MSEADPPVSPPPAPPPSGSSTTKIVLIVLVVVLLASCVICSGLIAIMLPALGAARQAAREGQSVSQLRQIGITVAAYANDHRGAFPIDPARLQVYGIDPATFISPFSEATVTLPGGDLLIEWDARDHVWMTGPTTLDYEGLFDPETGAFTSEGVAA